MLFISYAINDFAMLFFLVDISILKLAALCHDIKAIFSKLMSHVT